MAPCATSLQRATNSAQSAANLYITVGHGESKALEKLLVGSNHAALIQSILSQIIHFCFYFPKRLSDFSN